MTNLKYENYLKYFPDLSKFKDEKDPYLDNLRLLVNKDYGKAKEQCMENLNCSYFINNLAVIYEEQGDIEKAEKYYLMAISEGNSVSMCNLAVIYEEQGVIEKAEKYYLMAIHKGNNRSMNNLAYMYKKQEDIEKAVLYYNKAKNNDKLVQLDPYGLIRKLIKIKAENTLLKALLHL